MGSSDPPFLYDPPKRYSTVDPYNGFDPKAHTHASRRPSPSKPKPEGPLVDFNKHPDSYLILPYGKTGTKPMSPRTKAKVTWTRWVQFALRIMQLLGAIGMIICVICIRGTAETEGWIIRIPPGVDVVVGLYALYHLARPAKSRPAGSSASYHFFALVMDAGLIPFYVFTYLMSNSHYREKVGTEGRWNTFFHTEDQTMKILLSTWLIALTDGGLHLISVLLDLYLIIIFRKIAKMPPDMNPLEDNLTSRRATKHKHKSSSLSVASTMANQKHMSTMSGSTLNDDPGLHRLSKAEDHLIPDPRTIPFIHTRERSSPSFSPHNPATARMSQIYAQSRSARGSYMEVSARDEDSPYLTNPETDDIGLQRHSLLNRPSPSHLPSTNNISAQVNFAQTNKHDSLMSDSGTVRRSKPTTDNFESDNWFVHQDAPQDRDDEYDDMQEDVPPKNWTGRSAYESLPRYSLSDDPFAPRPLSIASNSTLPIGTQKHSLKNPPHLHPLGMNPPTPPIPDTAATIAVEPSSHRRSQSHYNATDGAPFSPSKGIETLPSQQQQQQNSTISRFPTQSSTYSIESTSTITDPRAATPKRRQYGDLAGAMSAIRNKSPRKPQSTNSPDIHRDQSPRVVSRTGIDEATTGLGGWMQRSRREVSGKVAEEGRGWAGNGLVQRKVSGVA